MKINTEELKNIIKLHNKWLNHEPGGIKADLRGADLREADFRGADLSEADLRGAKNVPFITNVDLIRQ